MHERSLNCADDPATHAFCKTACQIKMKPVWAASREHDREAAKG